MQIFVGWVRHNDDRRGHWKPITEGLSWDVEERVAKYCATHKQVSGVTLPRGLRPLAERKEQS